MNYLFFIFQKFTKYFLALFLFLILFVIFYNSNVEAACPTGNGDGQTINILSDDNCTSRISNPGTSVTVAGNLTVNSGDGAIYYNFNNHTVNITGTVTNTNAGTSHGIHDVTGSTSYTQNVTISGNGSVDGTAAGYYNQGSTVNLTNNQSDLTFKGLVPSSYKILIEGTSDFGKTTFVSPTGTLTFDIASTSSISSTGTYSSVLDDIPSSNISSIRTGTFGSYAWTLQLASGFSDRWDLVISDPPPTLSSSTPANNAIDVARDANIVLNFSKSVDVKSGNITIKKTSDDSTVETIDVASGQVTGTGTSQITVNPSSDFFGGFEYYVLIDATAFDDSSNNSYDGISSTTALSFTVVDMQDPTTNKDVVGSIDSQSQLAKSFITQSTSTVSNRLGYLRQNKDNQNLSKNNIKLDLGNAVLTSLTNELLAKNDKSIIPDNWSSWSEGSLSSSKIGDSTNSSSSETDAQAIALGFDTKLNDNDLLGFAIQYGKSDTDIGSSGSKTDSENINFSVYRTRPLDNDNFIEGMFGVGLIESDLTRISGSNTLTGSRNGTQIFGSINFGKTLDKGDFNLTPIARVDLGYTELDSYSETGTDALSYAKQTIESGLASIGLEFSDIVKFNDNKFKPFGSIEYGMDFSNSSDAKMNYVSDTSTIYTYTQGANSNHLITSMVGFEYITKDNLEIISSYKRIQGNESEQTDILNVSVNFKSQRETEYAMSVDGSEDLKAGFDVSKNINGFDLKFNANQSLSENSDQAANVSLSRSF
ncbi:autotransporter domain-containing protein [Candidatus Pelagibacter sp.]|nr:autotransporter domain-containing protein [Candidatus Pelagibacter sp.]